MYRICVTASSHDQTARIGSVGRVVLYYLARTQRVVDLIEREPILICFIVSVVADMYEPAPQSLLEILYPHLIPANTLCYPSLTISGDNFQQTFGAPIAASLFPQSVGRTPNPGLTEPGLQFPPSESLLSCSPCGSPSSRTVSALRASPVHGSPRSRPASDLDLLATGTTFSRATVYRLPQGLRPVPGSFSLVAALSLARPPGARQCRTCRGRGSRYRSTP